MKNMFEAILSLDSGSGPPVRCLSALKEIKLGMSMWDKGEWSHVISMIRLCAQCCGSSLEVWRGELPWCFMINCKLLGELFGMFKKLRVIHLKEYTIRGFELTGLEDDYAFEDGKIKEYLTSMASSCGALEEVFVTRRNWTMERWTVSRPGGDLGDVAPGCRVQRPG